MSLLQQLREKRAQLATQIRALADTLTPEKRNFDAEGEAKWKALNADYDATMASIQVQERAEAVAAATAAPAGGGPLPGREDRDGRDARDGRERRGERPTPTEEHRALALQAWLRRQSGLPLRRAHRDACRAVRLNPGAGQLQLRIGGTADVRALQRAKAAVHPSQHERALSAVSLAGGGATVAPETLIRSLEVNMLAFGGVLNVAEILRTANGERMSWPTVDDTGNEGEQIDESVAATDSGDDGTEPTFGKVFWDAYKFSSKELLIPTELLEDSAFDLPGVIGALLGERLGRIQAKRATTGTGVGTMKGIVTASTQGKETASSTAITADEVMDLVHSVDPAYRGPGAGFMLHDNVVLALRKLKLGDGQYLWQSGMQAGTPDRLYNYPYQVSMEMDSALTAAKKTILFGQLSKYKVRQVRTVRLYRLVERHRENDQDAFLAFIRGDGNLLDAGAGVVKHLRMKP